MPDLILEIVEQMCSLLFRFSFSRYPTKGLLCEAVPFLTSDRFCPYIERVAFVVGVSSLSFIRANLHLEGLRLRPLAANHSPRLFRASFALATVSATVIAPVMHVVSSALFIPASGGSYSKSGSHDLFYFQK